MSVGYGCARSQREHQSTAPVCPQVALRFFLSHPTSIGYARAWRGIELERATGAPQMTSTIIPRPESLSHHLFMHVRVTRSRNRFADSFVLRGPAPCENGRRNSYSVETRAQCITSLHFPPQLPQRAPPKETQRFGGVINRHETPC